MLIRIDTASFASKTTENSNETSNMFSNFTLSLMTNDQKANIEGSEGWSAKLNLLSIKTLINYIF